MGDFVSGAICIDSFADGIPLEVRENGSVNSLGEREMLLLGKMKAVFPEDEAPMCFERLAFTNGQLWALSFCHIFIWDCEDNTLVHYHDHHAPLDNEILSISAEGRFFATGHQKRGFAVWDMGAFDRLQSFEGHGEEVSEVAFVDEERLISCSGDGSLRLWERASGKECKRIEVTPIYCLALHPEKKLIAVGGSLKGGLGRVMLVDVESLKVVNEFELGISRKPFPAISESGKRSAGITASLRDRARIDCLTWHPDGRHLFAGSWDYTIKVIDTVDGTCLREWAGHSHWVDQIIVSVDGRQIISSGGSDGKIIHWALDSEIPISISDLKAPIGAMCISGDRLYVAVADEIRIFRLPPIESGVAQIDFSSEWSVSDRC